MRVQNLIRADLNIVLPQWITECHHQRHFIPLQPRFMMSVSATTSRDFKARFDPFGDSFFEAATSESLGIVFQNIDSARAYVDAHSTASLSPTKHPTRLSLPVREILKNEDDLKHAGSQLQLMDHHSVLKLESYCRNCALQTGIQDLAAWWNVFSRYVFYFDIYSDVNDPSTVLADSPLRISRCLASFYGANISMDIYNPRLTHVIVSPDDLTRMPLLRSRIQSDVKIVSADWIAQCVGAHADLSETSFMYS